MTDQEIKELAKDVANYLVGKEHIDNTRGYGYVTIASYDYEDEDLTINLFIDICKYRDDFDGHLFYGVYYCAEIDGGDNIMEHDWEITTACRWTSLAKTIKGINKTWTKEALLAEYKKNCK